MRFNIILRDTRAPFTSSLFLSRGGGSFLCPSWPRAFQLEIGTHRPCVFLFIVRYTPLCFHGRLQCVRRTCNLLMSNYIHLLLCRMNIEECNSGTSRVVLAVQDIVGVSAHSVVWRTFWHSDHISQVFGNVAVVRNQCL